MAQPVPTRPVFPSGYGLRDDEEGLLPWSQAAVRLEGARNYWVATTRPDGSPHAMPVWGLWLDDAFVFSSGSGTRKARNLALDPRVVVHLESGDDVVIVEGLAERVTDEDTRQRIAQVYSRKYEFDLDPAGDYPLFRVRPRVAYAWAEKDFPGTATRYAFP